MTLLSIGDRLKFLDAVHFLYEKDNTMGAHYSYPQMNTIFQRLSDRISKSLSKQTNNKNDSNERSSYVQKIYCRFCGKTNPVSLKYCLECKMPTAVPPSQVMKVCKKCGLAVNDDSIYCYSCGDRFDDIL